MKKLIEAIKTAFEAFKAANTNVRERALAHGEALFKLRAECKADGVNWTDVLVETGVPTSTAYDHLKLFEAHDEVRQMAEAMGWAFEEMSIKQIVDSLPDPKRLERKARKAAKKPTQGREATEADDGASKAKRPLTNTKRPSRTDQAREEAAKSFLKTTFGKEAKLYFQKQNQPITFDLGEEVVVLVPVK